MRRQCTRCCFSIETFPWHKMKKAKAVTTTNDQITVGDKINYKRMLSTTKPKSSSLGWFVEYFNLLKLENILFHGLAELQLKMLSKKNPFSKNCHCQFEMWQDVHRIVTCVFIFFITLALILF